MTPMHQAIEGFQIDMQARNLSERTIENYIGYTKRFHSFLRAHYSRITSWEKVNKDIMLDYQRYIAGCETNKGQPLANQTQILMLRSVRRFFAFLMKHDLVLKDPTTVITPPKEEQRIVRSILTKEETFELLRNVEPRNPVALRNRAIVETFYACGMRTSELCDLKIVDVDLKEQTALIVNGKGRQSRLVPLGQYASFYICEYLKRARKYMLRGKREDPGHLFLSQRGNPFNKSTLNKTVMRSVIHGLHLKKHISAYCFRHSVATQLLQNDVDIIHIAKLLGHASLRTTQRYLRVGIGDLQRMHSMYHPRESPESEVSAPSTQPS